MSFLRSFLIRFAGLFRTGRADRRLRAELDDHLHQLVTENLAKGMRPDEARAAARRTLGNEVRIGEEWRGQRSLPWLETFLQDARHGLRMMRKHPGFAAVAIATLALGIGANTAIFSVVDAVLLNPLPYHDPGRLVIVHERLPLLSEKSVDLPAPDILTFQQQSSVFTAGAGFRDKFLDLTGAGQPVRILAARVSWTLFPVLGVQPMLGRTFTKEEDDPGRKVTVLSYTLWKQQFGGDASIVGKTVALDRKPYEVIGVMPPGFVFPLEGLANFSPAALWVPMSFTAEEKQHFGDNFDYGFAVRLKPGVSLGQAQADASLIAARILLEYPANMRNTFHLQAPVTLMRDDVVGPVRTLMAILLGAVGLVLLIACVNVANLLLARTMSRQKEMAMRLALGAGPGRLLRQFVAENVVLALVGGALGILVAIGGDRLLVLLAPAEIPRAQEIGVNLAVLVFTLALSVAVGFAVGAAPAFAASGTNVNSTLKEGSRGSSTGRRHQRLRAVLVTSEIALALMLLAGAGLLIRSFVRARGVDPGFQAEHALSFSVSLPNVAYSQADRIRSFYRELRDRLARLPGVEQVGFSTDLPTLANWNHLFSVENYHPAPGAQRDLCINSVVSRDYFRALRIPLLRGRYFDTEDTPKSLAVVIVSQSLARRYWPNQNPLGKRLKWGVPESKSPWLSVVGVVGDVKQGALDQATMMHTYEPYAQQADELITHFSAMNFALRAAGDPAALASAVRTEVWALDPQLAIARLATMNSIVEKTLNPRRFSLFLLVAFAVLALVLAAIGIYGVISYSVGQRTHEMGIRMALGAGRADVLRLVVRQGLVLALAGVAIGFAGALALTRLLVSLLFETAPTDPLTFAAVSVLLCAVAVVASLVPAWRATRVDPTTALRYE